MPLLYTYSASFPHIKNVYKNGELNDNTNKCELEFVLTNPATWIVTEIHSIVLLNLPWFHYHDPASYFSFGIRHLLAPQQGINARPCGRST